MFYVRCTTNFKFFKFLAPAYPCYKVYVDEQSKEVWFYCFAWDYMQFSWISSKDIRPIFLVDKLLKFLFFAFIAFLLFALFR